MPGPSALPELTAEISFGSDPWAGYLRAVGSMGGFSGTDFVFYDLTSIGDYVVQAGDYLEYDVWWEGASQYGALDLGFTDGTYLRDLGVVDQNGVSSAPSTDLTARADGVWYHRRIPMFTTQGEGAGKTISKWDIAFDPPDSPSALTKQIRIRDVYISDSSGTVKLNVWRQADGIPTAALDIQGAGASSIALTKNADTPVWADVTPYFLEAHPRRGRQRERDVDEAGTTSLVLNNIDRRFDPANTASPYYPKVLPMRRVRLRATWPASNLQPNGGFESGDLTGWNAASVLSGVGAPPSAFMTVDTTSPQAGTYRALANVISGDTVTLESALLARTGGAPSVVFSGYFKKIAAVASKVTMALKCYDHAGALLGTVYRSSVPGGLTDPGTAAGFDPGTAGYVRYGGVFTGLPAGTTRLAILLTFAGVTGSAPQIAIDSFQLEPGSAVTAFTNSQTYWRFTGFIERWPPSWQGKKAEVSLTCVDGFEPLGLAQISGFRAVEQSGARVNWALDLAGWSDSDRNIDAGNSQVEQSGSSTGTLLDNSPALGHIQDIAQAEMGAFFIAADGRASFQQRQRRLTAPYNVSQGTFSNAPGVGEFLYLDPQPVYDKDDVYNDIRSRPVAATTDSIAEDPASQTAYGPRTLSESVWLTTLTECLNRAQYLLARLKQPSLRIDGIRVEPQRQDALWPQVLARELGDRITVKLLPYGGGVTITRDVFIESADEDIVARDGKITWSLQWALSPADVQAYWILGDANLSLLGQSTTLAY